MSFSSSDKLYPLMGAIQRFLALIFLLLCAGCATQGNSLPLHREMAPLPRAPICRVAVLPFINDSTFPQGNLILQKIVMSEFREAGDYQLLQEGDILKTYQQLRLFPNRAPSLEQMKIVADRVNAQLLITGIVMQMREDPGPYQTVIPKIIMELQVRDGRSGETLWTTYHRRLGTEYNKTMHFGTIHTIAGLGRQMVAETINLWFEKGLPQCNVFSQP